jgi:hypothetical protein
LHGQDGTIATGFIPIQERPQWLAVVPGWSALQLSVLTETGAAVAFEAPPPRSSSSSSSILRI